MVDQYSTGRVCPAKTLSYDDFYIPHLAEPYSIGEPERPPYGKSSISDTCPSRIFMQPSEDRHGEGRGRLGIQQRCRIPLLVLDDRPAHRCSRTGVFATDGSNPNTTT